LFAKMLSTKKEKSGDKWPLKMHSFHSECQAFSRNVIQCMVQTNFGYK
jgi:hypothetical protein